MASWQKNLWRLGRFRWDIFYPACHMLLGILKGSKQVYYFDTAANRHSCETMCDVMPNAFDRCGVGLEHR